MTKIAKDQVSQVEKMDGFEGRYEDLGGYTVGFESYSADVTADDLAPLFDGLPNGRCQCPHWGTVVKGTLAFHYGDGSVDVVNVGEAYYARPDHLPAMFAGTEIVEFSPTAELAKTFEVVLANLAAAGAR